MPSNDYLALRLSFMRFEMKHLFLNLAVATFFAVGCDDDDNDNSADAGNRDGGSQESEVKHELWKDFQGCGGDLKGVWQLKSYETATPDPLTDESKFSKCYKVENPKSEWSGSIEFKEVPDNQWNQTEWKFENKASFSSLTMFESCMTEPGESIPSHEVQCSEWQSEKYHTTCELKNGECRCGEGYATRTIEKSGKYTQDFGQNQYTDTVIINLTASETQLFDFIKSFGHSKRAKNVDDTEYPYCIRDGVLRLLMWNDSAPALDEAFVLTR